MIIDIITNKTYKGKKCRSCGCEEIYVIHTANPNPEFSNDIDKDEVFCRCNKCRYIPAERWDLPINVFYNVEEAIEFWNKIN